MRDIIEKLVEISEEISQEHEDSILRLFALIERNEPKDEWDLLVSADWLEKTNGENDIVYLIEKLKSKFTDNLDFLTNIITGKPNETFIKNIASAVIREGEESKEFSNLQVTPEFSIMHIFVIRIDFNGIELNSEDGTDDGPIAVAENTADF